MSHPVTCLVFWLHNNNAEFLLAIRKPDLGIVRFHQLRFWWDCSFCVHSRCGVNVGIAHILDNNLVSVLIVAVSDCTEYSDNNLEDEWILKVPKFSLLHYALIMHK